MKLLEDVGHKSQSIFGAARFYLNEHPDENISPLEAYLKAEALLKKASPRLLNAENVNNASQSNTQNEVITQVEVQVKTQSTSEESKLDEVELGIEQLAEKHVVEHEHTEQQSALNDAEEQEALTEKAELVTEQKTIDIEPASNKHS